MGNYLHTDASIFWNKWRGFIATCKCSDDLAMFQHQLLQKILQIFENLRSKSKFMSRFDNCFNTFSCFALKKETFSSIFLRLGT